MLKRYRNGIVPAVSTEFRADAEGTIADVRSTALKRITAARTRFVFGLSLRGEPIR